jgi:hypothetical protein
MSSVHFGFQSGRFFGDASFRVINRRSAASAGSEAAMESHTRVDDASGRDDFLLDGQNSRAKFGCRGNFARPHGAFELA